MKAWRNVLAASAAVLALSAGGSASARECPELIDLSLEDGAVTSAEWVAPGAFELPEGVMLPPGVGATHFNSLDAFCRVQATLTPTPDSSIKVEVWMPARDWNGKFVGLGNGVWAGQLSYSQLVEPLSRGYAVATTDTGHTGSGMTADWAIGHPEKLIDFGHRAVHLMTVTAKAAIADYYGEGPSLSLWDSCSTGGRQGLMSAYRHPEDYDAISALAPANPMTDLMLQSMWANWVSEQDPEGGLTGSVLGTIHRAVLADCDGLDGLEDGVVSRPGACNFDPGEMLCQDGQSGACLIAPHIEAMRAIYDGVRAEDGRLLLPGWPRGAEEQLALLTSGRPFSVAHDYYRLLVYGEHFGWHWQLMDFGEALADGRAYGSGMLDVPADGLSTFFARGGKLLLSHGWNDGLIPAVNTVNFYSDLYRALPEAEVQSQLRLFMAPGMQHCAGGEGPSEFDTLGVIDAWATSGKAPGRIIATRPTEVPALPGFPPEPDREEMSRPLCPYPLFPAYSGEGDTRLAENFTCKMPE